MNVHVTASSRRVGVIISGGALLVVAGGGATLALASYSGVTSGGQILSCMNSSTHSLRIVDHAACRVGETVLAWSQRGPAGATGQQGVAGTSGPTGAKGDTGASGATGPGGPSGAKGDTGGAGPAGSAGAMGPQGAAGAQGTPGLTGARGPSDGFYTGGGTATVSSSGFAEVMHQSLASAGKYMSTGVVTLENDGSGPHNVLCSLNGGSTAAVTVPALSLVTVTMLANNDQSGAFTITMSCWSPGSGTAVSATNTAITSTQVATLTTG